MTSVVLLLGFVTAAGIIYVAYLTRLLLEERRKQIAGQQEIAQSIRELRRKLEGS